jgi:hypothetical protein
MYLTRNAQRRGMVKALAAGFAVIGAILLAVFASAESIGVPATAIAAQSAQQFIGWSVTASVVVVGLLGYFLVRKTFF